MLTTQGHLHKQASTIVGPRACFLVKTVYQNGHTYWHGFTRKETARKFAHAFLNLANSTTVHFGVANMTEKQLREVDHANGCTLEEEFLSNVRRVE